MMDVWLLVRRSRRFAVTTAVAGLSILASACGEAEGGDAPAPYAVRDSAGIRIAESRAPAWGPGEGWRLAETPALEIGVAEGAAEYLLSGVVSTLRRGDGTIVLANGGSNEIRFYDAGGRHLRSVGRQGGGPGEFRRIFWVAAIRGDTLLAYDFPARRVSTLAPDGSFLRSVTADGFQTFPQIIAAFADGSLVVRTSRIEGLKDFETGVVGNYATFFHLPRTGGVPDTLHAAAPERSYQVSSNIEGGRREFTVRELFGASTILEAAGDSLFVGRNDRFELTVLSPGGEIRGLVRYLVEPRPVTDEVLQAAEEAARAEAEERGSDGTSQLDQALRNRPHAETLPFFMRILVDRVGNVWLHEYVPPGAEQRAAWIVISREGRLLGSLHMPENFTPHFIDDEYVLGVARDELGVERVRLYPILKGDE